MEIMRWSCLVWTTCLGLILTSGACKPKRRGVASLRQGQELLATSPSAAIKAYERAGAEGADSLEVKKGLAAAHERLGAFDDAEKLLREVTSQNPSDADARFSLARILLRNGQFGAARTALASVLEVEPPHPAIAITYAALAENAAQAEAGRRALERLKIADPGAGWAAACEFAFARAALSVASGAIPTSEAILSQADKTKCQSPSLTLILATVSSIGKRPRLAEWLLSRAADSEGAPDAVYEALAELALAQRHLPLAKMAISKLRTGVDPDLKALLLLTQLHDLERNRAESANAARRALDAVPPNDDAERRRVTLLRATALERAGSGKKAAELLEELLQRFPGFPPAMLLLANLRLRLKQADAAILLGNRLIEQPEMVAAGYQVLVSAETQRGNPQQAEAVARRFVNKSSSSADAIVLLANVLVRDKRPEMALREVEAGCVRHPGHFELLRARIALSEQTKGFEAAERVAREAVLHAKGAPILRELARLCERNGRQEAALSVYRELASMDVRALIEVTQVLERLGRISEALETIRQLVKVAPLDVAAQLCLGALEERSGDAHAAQRAYETALTLDPNSAIALNNLAMLCLGKLNDPNRALELARKAHAIVGDDLRVLDTLGWALMRHGGVVERGDAVRMLGRSSRGLHTAEGYYHYAAALFASGRPKDAQAELDRAFQSSDSAGTWRADADALRERIRQVDLPSAAPYPTGALK